MRANDAYLRAIDAKEKQLLPETINELREELDVTICKLANEGKFALSGNPFNCHNPPYESITTEQHMAIRKLLIKDGYRVRINSSEFIDLIEWDSSIESKYPRI